MRYTKGKSGNPAGRPRGSKNKSKAELMDRVKNLIENNIDTLEDDLKALDPKDRVKAIVSLLNYTLPKQQSVSADIKTEREQIVITNMSPESIATLEKIKNSGLNGLEG